MATVLLTVYIGKMVISARGDCKKVYNGKQ